MYREGEPIYQQVAQIIRSNIESGKWPGPNSAGSSSGYAATSSASRLASS